MSSYMGRPRIQNPKVIEVRARVDRETNKRILDYCNQNNINRTDFVRQGIDLLLGNMQNRIIERIEIERKKSECYRKSHLDDVSYGEMLAYDRVKEIIMDEIQKINSLE